MPSTRHMSCAPKSRADTLTASDLARYRVLVAPAVNWLTGAQAALVETFLAGGGRLLVLGPADGTRADIALTLQRCRTGWPCTSSATTTTTMPTPSPRCLR